MGGCTLPIQSRPRAASSLNTRRACGRCGTTLKKLGTKFFPSSRSTPLNSGRPVPPRAEEHTTEIQSLMRITYAVLFLLQLRIHDSHQTLPEISIKQINTY